MKQRFFVNPFLMAVSLATSLLCFLLVGCYIYLASGFASILLFLAIGLLFLYMTAQHGSTITIDEAGVTRATFGWRRKTLLWEEIAEVGVAGTKVLRAANSKSNGTLYIYLSPVSLNEDERFNMMLAWPPRQQLYLTFSKPRMTAIQAQWRGKIETYQAGDVFF